MKRPSYCGAVTIQCSIGGRYRFADTVCGAFGLVLTSRKSLAAGGQAQVPSSSAAYRFFIEFSAVSGCSWSSMHRRQKPTLRPKLRPRGIGKLP